MVLRLVFCVFIAFYTLILQLVPVTEAETIALSANLCGTDGRTADGSEGFVYLGDIDNSGSVTVSDAIMVLRHVVALRTLSEGEERQRGDVNLDGIISVSDAISILRKVVGLIDTFALQDPAHIRTEMALNYVIINSQVKSVILQDDIVLSKPLFIHRNISIDGGNGGNGGKKTGNFSLYGNRIVLTEYALSLQLNNLGDKENAGIDSLIINGGFDRVELDNVYVDFLMVDAGETVSLFLTGNTLVRKAHFKTYLKIYGGDRIAEAGIKTGIDSLNDIWMDGKPDDGSIYYIYDKEIYPGYSSAELLWPSTTITVEDTIPLRITLSDIIEEPVAGQFEVRISDGDYIWFDSLEDGRIVEFDRAGRATVRFMINKPGFYENLTVEVGGLAIDSFELNVVTVMPHAGLSELAPEFEEVEAVPGNIVLNISLISNRYMPLSGTFFVNAEYDIDGYTFSYSDELYFPKSGTAEISFTVQKAGPLNGRVFVDEVKIGSFTRTILPGPASGLQIIREPAGSDDGSGRAGTVELITVDSYGNFTQKGISEDMTVTASISEPGIFTADSVTQKNVSDDLALYNKVVFDNLIVGKGPKLSGLTISFYGEGVNGITSAPFDVIGISELDARLSTANPVRETITAGDELSVTINLKDRSGDNLAGTFLVAVGVGEELYRQYVIFEAEGSATLNITLTVAGFYEDVPIFVDGNMIAAISYTIQPAETSQLRVLGDIVLSGNKNLPLSVSVAYTDRFGNVNIMPGKTIELSGFILKDNDTIGDEDIFKDTNTRQVTDDSGIAVFDGLIFDSPGAYQLIFSSLSESFPKASLPVIILYPGDSLFWFGYPDNAFNVVEDQGSVFIIIPTEEDAKIPGLSSESFVINLVSGNKNKLTIHGVGELVENSGIYFVDFRYFDTGTIVMAVGLNYKGFYRELGEITAIVTDNSP